MIDVSKALDVVDNFAKYKNVKSILIKGSSDNKATISICIPTYKRVDTLKDTISSCLNQVGFDDYVIIVSDNNPERNDETEQYIGSLNNPRILYYKHEQNIGMYGNLNRLYELSKSEYTVCVHDDDLLLPNFIRICYEFLLKNIDVDIIYPDKISWDGTGDSPKEILPSRINTYKMGLLDFINDNPCPPTGMMCRTQSMIRLGGYGYDGYPSNDYYFNVKAINHALVYKINVELYVYRWAVNTSLSMETLLKFMTVDPPLIRYNCSKHFYTRLLYKMCVLDYSYYWVNRFRMFYPNESIKDVDKDVVLRFTQFGILVLRFFNQFMKLSKHISHYYHNRYFLTNK